MDLWTNTTRVWSRGQSGLGPIRVQMKKSKMEVVKVEVKFKKEKKGPLGLLSILYHARD